MALTYDSICTFPLPSDLFTLAIHNSSPVVALGLASGHVQLHRLPSLPSRPTPKSKATTPSTSGHGTIDTVWRTRRHKGSCRTLVFSHDGENLFTGGSDGILKVAVTETGRVKGKIAIPSDPNGESDPPTLLHALSPQSLLLATDSSALYLFDLRTNSTFQDSKPQQTYHPHYDYISSLTSLAPSDSSTSGYCRQWFSSGGSTVAVTDIRKGVIFESVDYEEELLSSTVIGGQGNSRIIAGSEKGFVRIWDEGVKDLINGKERRLYVEKGETLDVICPVRDRLVEEDLIAVGLGDGTVSFARTGKKSGVVGRIRHHELEGVVALGFDPDARLITGGGDTVKVWEKNTESPGSEADSIDEDSSSEGETHEVDGGKHHEAEQNGHDETEDESSEAEKPKRKKRKRNKGKGQNNNNHILAFNGMD